MKSLKALLKKAQKKLQLKNRKKKKEEKVKNIFIKKLEIDEIKIDNIDQLNNSESLREKKNPSKMMMILIVLLNMAPIEQSKIIQVIKKDFMKNLKEKKK